MKRLLFLFLLLPVFSYGQFRMVSSTVSLNTTVNDSTYIVDVDFFSDLTGGGYLATGITVNHLLFSQSGELYDITTVTNQTLSSARLTIVEVDNDYVDTEGSPTGQVIVFAPQGEYIPVTPFGNSNMGNVLQGAAIAYNSKVRPQLSIATIDDTSSIISPYEGQLVYVKDAGSYQVRGAFTWGALPTGSSAVSSVNSQTGAVVLDADDIDDTSTTNKFTTAGDISKLAGIESGATADQSDAEIETAYNNQVGIVSQAAAEAGTSTTAERWTPQRVAQAIAAQTSAGSSRVYDITDYGAIGTDTLSDQAAFDSVTVLLRNNPGGVMYLPDGEWTYTDTIIVPSNSSMIGESRDGVVIIADTPNLRFGIGAGTVYFEGENSYAGNFSIDGRWTPASWDFDNGSDGAVSDRTSGVAFPLESRNCIAENIKVRRVSRHGVFPRGKNNTARYIDVDSTLSYNVSFGSGSNLLPLGEKSCENCTLEFFKLGGVSIAKGSLELNDGLNGVYIRDGYINPKGRSSQGGALYMHTHSNTNEGNLNVHIERVTFDSTGGGTIRIVGALDGSGNPLIQENVTIKDCVILNSSAAVSVGAYTRNVEISNLTATNIAGTAISIAGSYADSDITPRNIRVIGGVIEGTHADGMRIDSAFNVQVIGLRLRGWTNSAMQIANSDSIIISGSTLSGGQDGTGWGIQFQGDTSRVVSIIGNTIHDSNAGIRDMQFVKDASVIANTFLNISGSKTTISGGATYAGNNIVFKANPGVVDGEWSVNDTDELYSSVAVGVGTDDPAEELHVNAITGNGIIQITNSTVGVTLNDGLHLVSHTNGDGRIILKESANLQLYTANSEKMRISAAGNVSIGTTAVGNKLRVEGEINAVTGFRVNNTAPLGEYLRGDGTNFVSSSIQEADLPARPATNITIAATPSNYTAGSANAEAHFAGIDAALATAGTDDQTASEVTAAGSATNYTPAAATVAGHLSGIDTELGNLTDAGNITAVDISDHYATSTLEGMLQELGTAFYLPSDGDTVEVTRKFNTFTFDPVIENDVEFTLDLSTRKPGTIITIKGFGMTNLVLDLVSGSIVPIGTNTPAGTVDLTGGDVSVFEMQPGGSLLQIQ